MKKRRTDSLTYSELTELFENLDVQQLNEFVFKQRTKLRNRKFLLTSIRLTKENLFTLKAFDIREYNVFTSLKSMGYKELSRFENQFNFPSRELWVLSTRTVNEDVKVLIKDFKSGKTWSNLIDYLATLGSKRTTDKEKLLLLWVLSTEVSETDLVYMIEKTRFTSAPDELKRVIKHLKLMNLIEAGRTNKLRDYCKFIPVNVFSTIAWDTNETQNPHKYE
jgi:hypothetical protein